MRASQGWHQGPGVLCATEPSWVAKGRCFLGRVLCPSGGHWVCPRGREGTRGSSPTRSPLSLSLPAVVAAPELPDLMTDHSG